MTAGEKGPAGSDVPSRVKLPVVISHLSQFSSLSGSGAKRREAKVVPVELVVVVVGVGVVVAQGFGEGVLGRKGGKRVEDAGVGVGIGLVEAGGGEKPAAGARAREEALARVDGAAS